MSPRQNRADADIEEPLLGDSRQYVKKGYVSAISSLILIYLLLALALRLAWGDTITPLSHLPDAIISKLPYTPPIPPSAITQRQGNTTDPIFTALVRVPFIFIEPAQAVLNASRNDPRSSFKEYDRVISKELRYIFSHPQGKYGFDTYKVTWNDSDLQLEELKTRVNKSLKKKRYDTTTLTDNQNKWDIEFRQKIDLFGKYTIENYNLTREGVETITVTITLPR